MFECPWCGRMYIDYYLNLSHMKGCRNKIIYANLQEKEARIKAVELLEDWMLSGESDELRNETGKFLSNVTTWDESERGELR